MTTPLSKLLTDLLTDPDGRAALGDDPARVLADNGWEDLTPRDMGDALRVVTASGPAAAAHAGSELPEQPTSWAEVVEPVLDATTELDSWDTEPGTPLVAGAIEPETYDFAPAPLVGVDPELTPDAHDDPFLRSDAERSDAAPEGADEPAAEAGELADAIDLGFEDPTEASDVDEAAPRSALDDLDADDGMTLRDAPGMDIADDLALPEDDAPLGGVDDRSELDEDLDLSWGAEDAADTDVDTVEELDPFVEVADDVDAATELDQGGPDQFDDLD